MEPKVGIVLVNYNGEKFQNACIETIKKMKYSNYEIILVDNDSKDNSLKMVRDNFDGIIIIETGENCGVAKGNNIGIKKALEIGCDYILLLNNDTEVHEDMLSNMVSKANETTMVTCKMYYYEPNNVIWCAGGKINWNKATTSHYGEDEVDNGQYDQSRYVEYTPTCSLLIHKSIFDKIGLMDENYFMYYDDTDFVVRANRAGFKIWYESNAKLWHKVSSSSGGSQSKISIYYGDRNRLYFIDKFYSNKFSIKAYYFLTRSAKLFKYLLTNKALVRIMFKAIHDYRNNLMYRQEL